MTRQEQIDELKRNIAQGEAFLAQGYECGMMVEISRILLRDLENEGER